MVRATNCNLRLFTVQRNASPDPVDDVISRWETSTPATALEFSAIGHAYITLLEDVLLTYPRNINQT